VVLHVLLRLCLRPCLRPCLALFTVLSTLYDFALYGATHFKRMSAEEIYERRAHRRGLVDAASGFAALKMVKDLADTAGARLFLVSGTLLGLHREGQLLAHDYDIDLGLMADDPRLGDFIAAMDRCPSLTGKKTIRLSSVDCILNPWLGRKGGDVVLYKYFFQNKPGKKEHFGIDVFVHFPANGHIVHGNFRCLWINTPFDLVERKFGALKLMVPADTTRYLRENYGAFEEQKLRFESSVDCPNTTNLYGVRAVAWLTGRYAHFLATAETEKRRVIGRRLRDCFKYGLFIRGLPRWRMGQYES
jgi:hypothetical protein